MAANDPDRELGVDFGSIDLEEFDYPIDTHGLVERYGDRSIERTNAEPITIRELFGGMEDEEIGSADELRQTMLNLMPEDSVGRKAYSDRGGSTPEDTTESGEEDEEVSL
jgi:hypothetical protein